MFSERLDRLLRSIRILRFLRMLAHLALLASGVLLFRALVHAAAEKYLFYYPVTVILLFAPLLLYCVFRTFALFRSEKEWVLAQELDQRYGLKDRIATYVQLRGSHHAFLAPLIREAETRLDAVSAARSAALQRGSSAPLLFTLIPALCLAVLPYLPVPEALAKRAEQHRQIVEAAKKLEVEAKKVRQEAQKLPEMKKLSEEMERLSRELQKPSVDPAEALKKLNAMQNRIQDVQVALDRQQKEALSRELSRLSAGESGTDKMSDSQRQQLRQMADELQKAIDDQNLNSGKELKEALENGKLSAEQMKKMKESIEKYKKEQSETEKRMSELQKSMENAKKSAQSGKAPVVYNSKVDDRNVETGKGGVDDGPGTTNKDIGPQHFDTRKKGQGEYAEDRTKADYEQLYRGQREKAGSDPLFLDGQWDPENARFTRIRTFGVDSEPGMEGGVTERVLQNEEESVIGKEKVPASYRKLVKKYFESIQP